MVGSNQECSKYWMLKIDRKSNAPNVPSMTPRIRHKSSTDSHSNINNDRLKYIQKRRKSSKNNRNSKTNISPDTQKSNFQYRSMHQKHTKSISSSPSSIPQPSSTSHYRRSGLQIVEDSTVYNAQQIKTTLAMIRDGNKGNGGLTPCISAYGIAGFVRFLEGYYIVLITDRRKVGMIGAHVIYKVEKTQMISLNQSSMDNSVNKRLRNDETRYKNLFSVIDLSKEFYFSYTYDLSRTLQQNMCNFNYNKHLHKNKNKPNHIFVWNEFLLKPLRIATKSKVWILPLIHGYFETKICSIYGREVSLTLISRRSKQYAGTRYLKRGINDQGHSANDIETEQILYDRIGGHHEQGQFASHVQMRASIPLFWVQDSNPMVPKPAIYIQKVDPSCRAIRRHFLSVFKRYGAPVLVLNLIKHHESHPREIIVGKELYRAMSFINSFLQKDYKIAYEAWDFKNCQRHKAKHVVDELTKFAEWSLQRTGFFHSNPKAEALAVFARRTYDINVKLDEYQPLPFDMSDENTNEQISDRRQWKTANENSDKNVKKNRIPEAMLLKAFGDVQHLKRRIFDIGSFQKGVLRVNCIDSLDRTNVAQFIQGKVALGYKLYALGFKDSPFLDPESDFIRILLQMYERMGDCLALQYGGSQMHRSLKKDHAESRSMAPQIYKQRDVCSIPSLCYMFYDIL